MTDPDDDQLWRAVTQGVERLKQQRSKAISSTPAVVAPRTPERIAPLPSGKLSPIPTSSKRSPTPPPLVMGQGTGVDKRTVQRLKRGRLAIEARLDLHGLTQSEAHARLDSFLETSQDRGLRSVLVITGKGRISREGGVLRRMVPQWLNTSPNRERVLTMSQSQPKDGGSGAIYLLIKKRC